MGWLSNLARGKKAGIDKDMEAVFKKIGKMLDDEIFQIEMLPSAVQALIRANAPCDERAGAAGEFGLSESNPVPVNGPLGELAYLSKLRTDNDGYLFFHRIGAIGTQDVFEAVSASGSRWFIFFLDMYYPRRSRKAPTGFTISSTPSQFSGFTMFCPNFPHDFRKAKESNRASGLSLAYISLSKAESSLAKGNFERPLSHRAKMDIVRSKLSSVLT